MEEFTSFLPLAVLIISSKKVIVETNEAFSKITGYELNEPIGSLLSDYFIEQNNLQRLIESVNGDKGDIGETELTLVLKDGSVLRSTVTIGTRRDIDGSLTGYYIGISPLVSKPAPAPISNDVEKNEVKSEINDDTANSEAVRSEQQKHVAIIDAMKNGLLVIDDNGNIDTINTHATEIFSVERQNIQGKPLSLLSEAIDLTDLSEVIKSTPDESRKIMVNNQTYDVEVKVMNTDDGTEYTLVILHNISKDEFIEDMKLTFVTVAAHQIRTPLSSIRWSLEILASQLEDEEQRDIAQRGYRSTQNVLEIVNALLNLDRLQSGEDGFNFEPTDIQAMISEYVDQVKANDHIIEQADIVYNKPDNSLPKVKADQEKISIVIRNLIDNALKYTPTDGIITVNTSVHVTNDYGSDMIQIEVKDNGIGIPVDSQEKIFSKFYRADNATKLKTDGTGIGLYISKHIIDEHDGIIWFESTEGEGTTFYIQLPIAQIQD